MLLTKEAKIPDDMGVIWCLTKHLRGQRILRMGNACTRFGIVVFTVSQN